MWDTHFVRYGYLPAQSLVREVQGLRFRLPAHTKGVSQTGLYSYFALAGDFEISASYELLSGSPPRGGYGSGLGLALDFAEPDESVILLRGRFPQQGKGYTLTHRTIAPDGSMKYESQFFACASQHGKLCFRREKTEVVCLAADNPKDPLRELGRVPFSGRFVRQMRLFADTGGSPTPVDVRVRELIVRADEITGGMPLAKDGGWGWWVLIAVSLSGVTGIGLVWYRRRVAQRSGS
jgi:hypothetical protein